MIQGTYHYNRRLLLMAVLGPFLAGCGELKTHPNHLGPENNALENAEAAQARCNDVTGLGRILAVASCAQVKPTHDTTPFLHRQIALMPAWRVTYGAGSLVLRAATSEERDQYQRTFVALVEKATGRIISVTSSFVGPRGDMRPEPSAASAERQLKARKEAYLGLPTVAPKVTFLDALNVVLRSGTSSPLQAKEIAGQYLLHTHLGSEPKPVWIITLRGVPPIPPVGPPGMDASTVPVWQLNHLRVVIDAMTGQFIFGSSDPQPDGT